ncbi:MAG: phosphoribosylformylglycinamidine synthase subunit PurQ, partial [Bdellovibrionales bacterium]|nr:phosphoribosylformylglycinamidine synthase subunit PurQ [Bdellovibrionales bacterium]
QTPLATERFESFDKEPLDFKFPTGFSGRAADCGADLHRRESRGGPVAAVVREKGTNGEREMAFALFAAGFEVRDVTMRDLISGAETLEEVSFLVFPGGFSNSDVLGSSRGWAGAFRFNESADRALRAFYARSDTLSLGVCNGCQLMGHLGLLYPEHDQQLSLEHNASRKFESIFLNVDIAESTAAVMLQSLRGTRLGIWVAHGEGRFSLPQGPAAYDISARYRSASYPANPNGSDGNAAAVCSADGRHLAIMPHLERSLLPWNWGYYPRSGRGTHEVSPWMLAFADAKKWIDERR